MTIKDAITRTRKFLSSGILRGAVITSLIWACVLMYQSMSHEDEIKNFKRKANLVITQKDLELEKQKSEFNKDWVEFNELLFEQRKLIERMGNVILNYKYTIQELLKKLQDKPPPPKIPESHIA